MEFEVASALVDGELDATEQAGAIEQIGQCPTAKARYETALILKQVLRDKCAPFECDEVWKSCRSRLDQIDKARRTESFVGRYAWGICGAFLVLIVGAATLNRVAGNQTVYAGDISAMVGSMSPADVTGSRIRDWISRKLGGQVVDLPQDQGLVVESAASCALKDRNLLKLILRDGEVRMALFAITKTDEIAGVSGGVGRTLCRGRINNLNAIAWNQNGNALLLIGDCGHDRLEQTASRIRVD